MGKATLAAACDCIFCLWRRALGAALTAKMDREIMEEIEEIEPSSSQGQKAPEND